MIRDAAYHLDALRTNGRILESLRRMGEPKALRIDPERVIRALNKAGLDFVVIGSFGITGYLVEPQATQDLDVLVRRGRQRLAAAVVQEVYPKLILRGQGPTLRLDDPVTAKVRIHIWRPVAPLLKVMWKHAVLIEGLYRIPCLEMALAGELTTMLSPGQVLHEKYLDAANAMSVVLANQDDICLERVRALGEVAAAGSGAKYVGYVRDVRAGRMIRF
jgi:hypothetical protein